MKKRIPALLAVLLLAGWLTACTDGDSSGPALQGNGTETEEIEAETEMSSASAPSEAETAVPNPADGSDWGPFV